MRILFVSGARDHRDGWSVYARGLSSALVAAGHEVIYPPEGTFISPISYLANPLRSFLAARKLTRFIRNTHPDVIHFIIEPYATVIPFLPRAMPPIVITAHGTYSYFPQLLGNPLKHALAHWMLTAAYRRAARIVCVSAYTKRALLSHIAQIERKIDVIPNGVAVTAEAKSRTGRPTFLFVGGVKLRKGVLEAVEAMAAYRDAYGSDFHFNVVGSLTDEPWYVERIRARIIALQLESIVELVGSVSNEERERYYQNADAFIMLNVSDGKEFEGFGLVYLEANAYGVPAIGTRGTAAEEAIAEGKSGYVVAADDVHSAVLALHRIVGDQALRTSARTWAEAHSWASIAARYTAVYTGLI